MNIIVIRYTGKSSRNPLLLIAGISIGLIIVFTWWFTGSFTQDDFSSVHKPGSVTYAGPISNAAVILTTGSTLSDGAYFGIAILVGTMLGSFLNAIRTHSFHWTLPEKNHLQHLIIGGSLMGFGAILAGGCNIGQGLTGLSTLSLKSIIAVAAIIFGMRIGVAWLARTEGLTNGFKIKLFKFHFKHI